MRERPVGVVEISTHSHSPHKFIRKHGCHLCVQSGQPPLAKLMAVARCDTRAAVQAIDVKCSIFGRDRTRKSDSCRSKELLEFLSRSFVPLMRVHPRAQAP